MFNGIKFDTICAFHASRGITQASQLPHSQLRYLAGVYFEALIEHDEALAWEIIAERLSAKHLMVLAKYTQSSSQDIQLCKGLARKFSEAMSDVVVAGLLDKLDAGIQAHARLRGEVKESADLMKRPLPDAWYAPNA